MQFKTKKLAVIFIIFLTGSSICASELSKFKDSILGAKNGVEKQDFMDSAMELLVMRHVMPGWHNDRIGCGCSVRNRAIDVTGSNSDVEFSRENIGSDALIGKPSIILYGDSRFAYMLDELYKDAWGEFYFNAAVGGSTSGNLKKHFDRCSQRASGNYHFTDSDFYPDSPGMSSLENPPRDHLGVVAPVQLENTMGMILTGGNDINMYKPILKALPFLVPLRIGNIINNLNRVVSYHQAQNANAVVLSQIPLPAGDLRTWEKAHIQKTRSYIYSQLELYNKWNKTEEQEIDGYRKINAASNAINYLTASSLGTLLIADYLTGGANPDHLWVSSILKNVSAMSMVFVSHRRKTGFIDIWSVFQVPGTHYPIARNEFYYDDAFSLKDGIHPSFTGHLAMIVMVRDYATRHNLERDRVADFRDTGDRCQVIDEIHLPAGQPATWTPEPEPLPEANDDLLLLWTICFATGNCK